MSNITLNTNFGSNAAWMKKFKDTYVDQQPSTTFQPDQRIWKPSYDAEKGGVAVVRFLPHRNPEELPFVEVISHWFEANGVRYTEKSLASLQKPDPVSELNHRLWNTGNDGDKEQAKQQKRNKKYYANVLVIQDPEHPENNGKVFIYEFGYSIFRTIQDSMFPQVKGLTPINPFDTEAGYNFNIHITTKKFGGRSVPNYEKSMFDMTPTRVDNIEAVMAQTYDLSEFLDPSKFKSYEELADKLYEVLGPTTGVNGTVPTLTHRNVKPAVQPVPVATTPVTPTVSPVSAVPVITEADDDDVDIEHMKALLANLED